MAVSEEAEERFKRRTVGRQVNEASADKYLKWARRFEQWLPENMEPDLAAVIDFDNLLYDPDRTEYPWETSGRGRPPADQYAYRSRIVALSALKLWIRLEYDTDIGQEPQNIAQGEPEDFKPTYHDRDTIWNVIGEANEACDCPGCHAAIRLAYDAIMRTSEVVRVRREDIDFDAGTVYVRATKGSRASEIAVEEDTIRALKDHVDQFPDREKLFYNSYQKKPWTKEALSVHFRRKHEENGFHSFARHSPIVHRLEEGEAFGDVYRRARHSAPTTTARYARLVGREVPEFAET